MNVQAVKSVIYKEIGFSLGDDTVVLCGPVSFSMNEQSLIFLDQQQINKPYLGTVVDTGQGHYYVMILHDPQFRGLQRLGRLSIAVDGKKHHPLPDYPLDTMNRDHFLRFFTPLSFAAKQAIFALFSQELATLPATAPHRDYCSLYLQLREQLTGPGIGMEYGCFLSPNMVYLTGEVRGFWPHAASKLQLATAEQFYEAPAHLFQISHNHYAAIAIFPQDVYTKPYESYHVTLMSDAVPLPAPGAIVEKHYGLEFTQYLSSRPNYQKHLIREHLCRAIIDLSPPSQEEAARHLIHKLQHFVQVPAESFTDPSVPFGIYFENIIPIGCEGVFLSGWMRDPFGMLENIEILSTLGFSLSVRDHIYRFRRPDVSESFQHTPYGGYDEEHGFAAYAVVPEATRQRVERFGTLHSMRFKVTLKGGITLDIVPHTQHRDVFAARDFVMKILPPDSVSDDMLTRCIGPAASKLQALCMEEVGVRDVFTVGATTQNPRVSIIIPLYRQLEFIKVQFAVMAGDASMRDCELIYVLDSPEQEAETKQMLRDYSALYNLPATLVTLKRNSGYAAANNAGARHARGEFLVLLNSDVIPKTRGWATAMADYYAANKTIGALAPKLLYEDESLQHAGMYFTKTTFPFYINLHYHKGYPEYFAAAQQSRAVPAVTGACLMIKRALYEKIGGLSTDFVIGDFEDSDLCLKCAKEGLESWYFADAALYHLERQSVPLNNSYTGGLAWRYNARLHHAKWSSLIELLMQKHSA